MLLECNHALEQLKPEVARALQVQLMKLFGRGPAKQSLFQANKADGPAEEAKAAAEVKAAAEANAQAIAELQR